jgi:hypothetical protein
MLLAGALAYAPWNDAAAAGQDYCKYGNGVTLVLVDRTTQYDDLDRRIFVEGVDVLFGFLELGERVILQTIEDGYANSRKLFDSCLPGCPPTSVFGSLLSECRGTVARADATRFKRDLAREIKAIVDAPQSFPRSEIILTISTLTSQYATVHDNGTQKKLTKLFVFSDLLENSASVPWPQIATPSTDRTLARVKQLGSLPRLAAAKVYVYGFGRLHDPARSSLTPEMRQSLIKFWTSYFNTGGAGEVHIDQRLN